MDDLIYNYMALLEAIFSEEEGQEGELWGEGI